MVVEGEMPLLPAAAILGDEEVTMKSTHAPAWAAMAAVTALLLACGSGSNSVGTGCSGLSQCCSMLSGAEVQACEGVVTTPGVTDMVCNATLAEFQAAGFCGGSAGSVDVGGGCSALSACCPDLPVSQNPTECITVANEGTAKACSESLATYQSAGYCEAEAGVPSSGSHYFCYFASLGACSLVPVVPGSNLSVAEQSCADVVVSCPTSGLAGCCSTSTSKSTFGGNTCYYEVDGAVPVMTGLESCKAGGGTWSTGLPPGW